MGILRKALLLSAALALSHAELTKAQGPGGNPPVVINELLASNTKSAADPQGEFDDWIELYNAGQCCG